jgi:hypothetical protein
MGYVQLIQGDTRLCLNTAVTRRITQTQNIPGRAEQLFNVDCVS